MMRRVTLLLLATVFLMVLLTSTALAGNGNGKCDGDCSSSQSWVRRNKP